VSKVRAHPSEARPAGQPSVRIELLRTVRVKQWPKNLLVLAAPFAAGVLTHGTPLVRSMAALVTFCVVSAGTYCINDAVDMEADRAHPTKKNRPVAAGTVSRPLAVTTGVALMAIGIAAGTAVAWRLGAVLAIYVALQFAYSLYLKHQPVLDLVTVAAGFVLRAIAGAVAVPVPASEWFLIVATFGSLLIVTGKRMAEQTVHAKPLAPDGHPGSRASAVTPYTPTFLRTVLAVAAAGTVTAYCLWAFSLQTALTHHHDAIWYQLSIVPMIIALLRYVFLIDAGKRATPEELLFGDRPLQVLGLAWVVLFALGVYAS
jgi:decaprenyl-phosphate phosphoribosyltransferase